MELLHLVGGEGFFSNAAITPTFFFYQNQSEKKEEGCERGAKKGKGGAETPFTRPKGKPVVGDRH